MPILIDLAALIIENASFWVRASEIEPIEEKWKPLLEVGLVVERSHGIVSFPLLLLAEWFAAKKVIESPSIIQDCSNSPQKLERWKYPLAIAIANLSHERVSELLKPITENYPTFTAEVIKLTSANWSMEQSLLTSSAQCGQQIQQSMQAGARHPLRR